MILTARSHDATEKDLFSAPPYPKRRGPRMERCTHAEQADEKCRAKDSNPTS